MKDEERGCITGGSLESLIEQLILPEQFDKNFPLAWILTYRSVITPVMFLCELGRHFNRKDPVVQQCICNFIESWIASHYYDLEGDGNTIRSLLAFLDNPIAKNGFVEDANRCRTLIRNQMTTKLLPERVIYDSAPPSVLPPDLNFLTLTDLDDLEIARQLSLIDQAMFKQIKPREFLNLAWTTNDKEIYAPNISRILARFDDVVRWVITNIVKLDYPKRPLMLSKFIQIAKHCKNLRNYNGCMQIMTAIEDSIMLRFDGTWDGLSQKYVPVLLDLRKTLSKANHYQNLKIDLYSKTVACVPYLRLCFSFLNAKY